MQFDMNCLNAGSWFELEGGGQVCLRVCDGDALRDIRKRTVKKKVEYNKVLMQRLVVEDTNTELQEELIWDYCIVDWKDFFDQDNQPISCTYENKQTLMGKSITFAKFVGDCLGKIRDDIEKDTVGEEAEKNF